MEWNRFFKPPAIRCEIVVGSVVFALGTLGSIMIALGVNAQYASLVDYLELKMSDGVTFSEVQTTIKLGGYEVPVTLNDLKMSLSESALDKSSQELKKASAYIFNITLAICLFLTALSTAVACLCEERRGRLTESEEAREGFMRLPPV